MGRSRRLLTRLHLRAGAPGRGLEQRKPTATSSRYDSRHHVHRQLVGLTGLHIIRSSGYQWVRYNER